jgi:hypothetical protein
MRADVEFFEAHPAAHIFVRPSAAGDHPDAGPGECLCLVVRELGTGDLLREIVPFAPVPDLGPVALDPLDAKTLLLIARNALPGETFDRAARRVVSLLLAPIEGTA